jgi:hypothetical protein
VPPSGAGQASESGSMKHRLKSVPPRLTIITPHPPFSRMCGRERTLSPLFWKCGSVRSYGRIFRKCGRERGYMEMQVGAGIELDGWDVGGRWGRDLGLRTHSYYNRLVHFVK